MLKVNPLILPSGGSLDEFPAGAVQFRNQTYAQRTAELTGNANSKVGTCSFWMKRGYWGQEERIIDFPGGWSPLWIGADDKIYWATNDVGGSVNPCYFGSTIVIPQDLRWHHYAFAFSLGATSKTQLYIDGISRGTNITAPSNTVVGWTGRGAFLLCRRYDSDANYVFGSLAEFYFNNKEFFDLSVPDNLAKLRNPSSGKPVNLGPDGSWVTGSKPIVYLRLDFERSDDEQLSHQSRHWRWSVYR